MTGIPAIGAVCAAWVYRPRKRYSPVTVLRPSSAGPSFLTENVVQVVGPVHGGPGVRLGQHQLFAGVLGSLGDLGGQLAQRVAALPVVAQDAEPGARHRAQAGAVRRLDQVVLAIAEEQEVAGRQPAEQIAEFGCVIAGRYGPAAQVVGQPAGGGRHPLLILDRDPHVLEHVAQVRLQALGRDPVAGRLELDVDPGFHYLGGDDRPQTPPAHGGLPSPVPPWDLLQRAGHVAAHPQQRVHEQADLGLVPVQPGGDRVDQVGHVVGDDVHDQAGRGDRVQVRVPGLTDLDQGPALRPVQAEPEVRLRDRGQPRGRGQVLGGHPVVVGAQVAQDAVAVAQHGQVRVPDPGLGRLDQESFPALENVTVRDRVHYPLLCGSCCAGWPGLI